jgi:hypothetical protein
MNSARRTAITLIAGSLLVLAQAQLLVSRPEGARLITVGGAGLLLVVLALTRPRLAIVLSCAWLPFLALTRRALYLVSPYTSLDPILLIAPLTCAVVVTMSLVVDRDRLVLALRQTTTAKLFVALMCIFMLEMLNPLQGGIAVGIGGALFYVAPFAWFVVGRLHLARRDVVVLVCTMVIASFFTSLYGLRQAYFGFFSFERYWIENGGYNALNVGGVIRPVSTFTSSAEFVTYAACGAAILLASLRTRRPGLLVVATLVLPVIGWAIVSNGTRGVVVRLVACAALMFVLSLRSSLGRLVSASVVLAALVIGMSQWSYTTGQYRDIPMVGTFLENQAQGLKDPFGETSTLPSKVSQARSGIVGALTEHPLGVGIGSGTLAAAKFGGLGGGLEMDITEMFRVTGLPGGIVYLVFTVLLARHLIQLWKRRPDWLFTALIGMYMIMFGTALTGGYYALTPIWWVLMGWAEGEYAAAFGLAQSPAPAFLQGHRDQRGVPTRHADRPPTHPVRASSLVYCVVPGSLNVPAGDRLRAHFGNPCNEQ